MEYNNLFLGKTEEELQKYYEQYVEWNKTAVLGNNELGSIRDKYCEMGLSTPLLVLELDLLRTIAERWHTKK